MMGLAWATRVGLVGALALVVGALAVLRIRQNRQGRIGGAIAPAKLVWLGIAVYTWFILAPVLALDSAVPTPARIVLGSFGICMWARGPIELFMMYVTRNWRPPYGIAHDALCLVVVLATIAWQAPHLVGLAAVWWLLFAVVVVSLSLELVYARAFLRLVGRRTMGDDAVWFASAEDPAFRRIVRLTALFNGPLLVGLALCLVAALGGGGA